MHECLAIKPDLVFLWDEAWFAFAGFHPIYRRRTAMAAAPHPLHGAIPQRGICPGVCGGHPQGSRRRSTRCAGR